MNKKNYDGLRFRFIPIERDSILTGSKTCSVVSVQYYVGEAGWSACTTDIGDGDGEGYSYNWNQRPF